MKITLLLAAIAVLICSATSIVLGQGQVYEIWVRGADSSDVVGAKVYVEYGGQRPYYVGNTNSGGEVRTPSDVESGLHKVTVKMGKKCISSEYYDFVPGRTVEVGLPCYSAPQKINPDCPSVKDIEKLISGWKVGTVELQTVVDAINKWSNCDNAQYISTGNKEQQKAKFAAMLQNPTY
jgi:hypothetical protein